MKPSKFTKREWSYIFYDWAESCFYRHHRHVHLPLVIRHLDIRRGSQSQRRRLDLRLHRRRHLASRSPCCRPILGTISDYQGYKKKFFRFFFLIGVVFTILLAFYPAVNERTVVGRFDSLRLRHDRLRRHERLL
ncbi:MAG: hypothetical protein MZU97_17910 [Bacillus subtilis]|nr:hypothetical protein [Bacillus subtilis]